MGHKLLIKLCEGIVLGMDVIISSALHSDGWAGLRSVVFECALVRCHFGSSDEGVRSFSPPSTSLADTRWVDWGSVSATSSVQRHARRSARDGRDFRALSPGAPAYGVIPRPGQLADFCLADADLRTSPQLKTASTTSTGRAGGTQTADQIV